MKQSMQGQHALVTGGAGGIGLELAKACLRRGASVSIIDLAKEMSTAREELTQAKPDHGPILSFNFYNADVGNFAEVQKAVNEAEKVTGPVTILVPNAGVPATGRLTWEEDVEVIDRVNRVNYLGVMYTLKAALPDMVQRGTGRVLLVSTLMASLGGFVFGGCYGGPKSAIRSIALTLHKELAGTGVTVTLLQPGFVDTPMTRASGSQFHPNAPALARELYEEQAGKPQKPDVVAELAVQALESGRFLAKAPDAASSLMIAAGATHPRMHPWPVELLLTPIYVLLYLYLGSAFESRIRCWRRGLWSKCPKS